MENSPLAAITLRLFNHCQKYLCRWRCLLRFLLSCKSPRTLSPAMEWHLVDVCNHHGNLLFASKQHCAFTMGLILLRLWPASRPDVARFRTESGPDLARGPQHIQGLGGGMLTIWTRTGHCEITREAVWRQRVKIPLLPLPVSDLTYADTQSAFLLTVGGWGCGERERDLS